MQNLSFLVHLGRALNLSWLKSWISRHWKLKRKLGWSGKAIACRLLAPNDDYIQMMPETKTTFEANFEICSRVNRAPSLELRTTLNLTHGTHLPLASKIGWRYCPPLTTSNVKQNEDWQQILQEDLSSSEKHISLTYKTF